MTNRVRVQPKDAVARDGRTPGNRWRTGQSGVETAPDAELAAGIAVALALDVTEALGPEPLAAADGSPEPVARDAGSSTNAAQEPSPATEAPRPPSATPLADDTQERAALADAGEERAAAAKPAVLEPVADDGASGGLALPIEDRASPDEGLRPEPVMSASAVLHDGAGGRPPAADAVAGRTRQSPAGLEPDAWRAAAGDPTAVDGPRGLLQRLRHAAAAGEVTGSRPIRAADAVEAPGADPQGDIAGPTAKTSLRQLGAVRTPTGPGTIARAFEPFGRTQAGPEQAPEWGRAMLDRIGSLDRRVMSLTVRLDRSLETQGRHEAVKPWQAPIEHGPTLRPARRIGAHPGVAPDALRRVTRDLARLAASIEREPTPSRARDVMVCRLAKKLDEIAGTRVESETAGRLQAQIATLEGRVHRGDVGQTTVVSIQQSMGRLLAMLDETQDAVVEAADRAATAAARDAMASWSATVEVRSPQSDGSTDAALEAVKGDIAMLREGRDRDNQLLDSYLDTLVTAIHKIIGRLDVLEDGAFTPALPAPAGPESDDAAPADAACDPTMDRLPGDATTADHAGTLDGTVEDAHIPPPAGQDGFARLDPPREADAPLDPEPIAPVITLDPAPFDAPSGRTDDADGDAPGRSFISSAARRASWVAANVSPPAVRFTDRAPSRRRLVMAAVAGLALLLGSAEIARLSLAAPEGTAALQADDIERSKPIHVADAQAPQAVETSGQPLQVAVATTPSTASSEDRLAPAPSDPVTFVPGSTAGLDTAVEPAGLEARLLDQARQGNASAQFEIGLRMADGRGVARDPKGAAGWFEKAAGRGVAPAAYRLASLYETGNGVGKDLGVSLGWFEKAAVQGNVKAMHNVAVLSASGAGGKPDYAKAALWFAKAARAGVRNSQFNLAMLYARGLGLQQDFAQAYVWFAIAAAQGDPEAAGQRDETAHHLDANNLAEAKKTAAVFYPTATAASANDEAVFSGGWDVARSPRNARHDG